MARLGTTWIFGMRSVLNPLHWRITINRASHVFSFTLELFDNNWTHPTEKIQEGDPLNRLAQPLLIVSDFVDMSLTLLTNFCTLSTWSEIL